MGNKLFYNENGEAYYILFGKQGERALLLNINKEQYVICRILEKISWWNGSYYIDFDSAYQDWKEEV